MGASYGITQSNRNWIVYHPCQRDECGNAPQERPFRQLTSQRLAMDFLHLAGKTLLVFGVANKKSVAYHVGQTLEEVGAKVVYVVRSEERRQSVAKLLPGAEVCVCDVEFEEQIAKLRDELAARGHKFAGMLHSIAFADYDDGMKPFHETPKRAFLRAMDISCYSLMALSNSLRELLEPDASVVTVSISTTRMASENYGYMAPLKAALDSSLAFLAKSFSRFSKIRFNAVAPGLLKTSASAGIPGYVDSYLYAEQVIPRKEAVATQEAADVAVFLLSPRSSGINAQSVVVDAGMSINYFDADIVRRAMRPERE
jgi:enoyl-[acyl-carrier protein] reductase I